MRTELAGEVLFCVYQLTDNFYQEDGDDGDDDDDYETVNSYSLETANHTTVYQFRAS